MLSCRGSSLPGIASVSRCGHLRSQSMALGGKVPTSPSLRPNIQCKMHDLTCQFLTETQVKTWTWWSRARSIPQGRTGVTLCLACLLHSAQAVAPHHSCSKGLCAGKVPLESEFLLPQSSMCYVPGCCHPLGLWLLHCCCLPRS